MSYKKNGYESEGVLFVSIESNVEKWVLDSGCSFHMTSNQHWYDAYKEIDEGKVLMGTIWPGKS